MFDVDCDGKLSPKETCDMIRAVEYIQTAAAFLHEESSNKLTGDRESDIDAQEEADRERHVQQLADEAFSTSSRDEEGCVVASAFEKWFETSDAVQFAETIQLVRKRGSFLVNYPYSLD